MAFKQGYLVLFFICICCGTASAWGHYGHRLITRQAIRSLPPAMQVFFQKNAGYLAEHSLDADKRRYCNMYEGGKHYIDLEYYGNLDSLPHYWKDAVAKYSQDSINAWGSVPWAIQLYYYLLVEAFKAEDAQQIADIAAELSHYVSDAHVPLHTTVNYDGQLSGQHGLHAFWESDIPEREACAYKWGSHKAVFVNDLSAFIWSFISQAHKQADTVMKAERTLSEKFPAAGRYCFGKGAKRNSIAYTDAYIQAYSEQLNGMVERQLKASVHDLASLWFTAWVEAGQPDMARLAAVQLRTEEPEGGQEHQD